MSRTLVSRANHTRIARLMCNVESLETHTAREPLAVGMAMFEYNISSHFNG